MSEELPLASPQKEEYTRRPGAPSIEELRLRYLTPEERQPIEEKKADAEQGI